MSEVSASTDSHSRLFLLMPNSGSGTVDSADDNGRDLCFSGFVKPVVKKRKGHVERVLRRMGR